ncbi:MAG: hypothetical protein ACR2RL_00855, partial [Gammaproteobacteria bacterium]
VTIEERDELVPSGHTLQTIEWARHLVWHYGEVEGGTLARGIMAGEATLQLLDPNRAVYDHITGARELGAEDKDFRVHIATADDDSVSLWGIVRIKNISTPEAVWTSVPVTEIQIYDGLLDSDRLIAQSPQILELIDILSLKYGPFSADRALPVATLDYRTDFTTGNAAAGFPFPVGLVMTFAKEKYKNERLWSKIVSFWTHITWSRLWQGLDGRFHLEQPHLTGRAGSVIRVSPYTPSFEAVAETTVQLTRESFGSGQERFDRTLHDPVVAVEIDRAYSDHADPNALLSYFYTLLRAGSFDSDDNRALEHWKPGQLAGGSGEIDSRGDQGDCLLLGDDEANEQALPWLAADQRFYLQLRLKYALENVSTSGTHKAHLRIRYEPYDTVAGQTVYVQVEGAAGDNVSLSLTTTNTVITSAAQSLSAGGADPLTWHDWFLTLKQNTPFPGRYVVELLGSSALGDSGYNTCFDSVQAYIAQPDSDDGTGKPARTTENRFKTLLRKFAASDAPLIGQTVTLDLEIPHISGLEGFSVFDVDEKKLYQHTDFTSTPTTYSVNHFSYAGIDYTDPAEMDFAYLKGFSGSFREVLEGIIKGLRPPEVPFRDLDGQAFTMLSGSLDFIEETTAGRWIENTLSPIVLPPGTLPDVPNQWWGAESQGTDTEIRAVSVPTLEAAGPSNPEHDVAIGKWSNSSCFDGASSSLVLIGFNPTRDEIIGGNRAAGHGIWRFPRTISNGVCQFVKILEDTELDNEYQVMPDTARQILVYRKTGTNNLWSVGLDGSGTPALLYSLSFTIPSLATHGYTVRCAYNVITDKYYVPEYNVGNDNLRAVDAATGTVSGSLLSSSVVANGAQMVIDGYNNRAFYSTGSGWDVYDLANGSRIYAVSEATPPSGSLPAMFWENDQQKFYWLYQSGIGPNFVHTLYRANIDGTEKELVKSLGEDFTSWIPVDGPLPPGV